MRDEVGPIQCITSSLIPHPSSLVKEYPMSEQPTSVLEAEAILADTARQEAADRYGSDNVQIFRDAAHIRQRPSMYIGNVASSGLHHLVYELVYNSVDEALAGHCKNIHVKINVDGSLSVSDDGRGIPVEEHAVEKRPTLEVVMTMVGAGAKFDNDTYKVSAGRSEERRVGKSVDVGGGG